MVSLPLARNLVESTRVICTTRLALVVERFGKNTILFLCGVIDDCVDMELPATFAFVYWHHDGFENRVEFYDLEFMIKRIQAGPFQTIFNHLFILLCCEIFPSAVNYKEDMYAL